MGTKHTPERIENIRRAMMGHVVSAETRAKMAASAKGFTPEARAKGVATRKARRLALGLAPRRRKPKGERFTVIDERLRLLGL